MKKGDIAIGLVAMRVDSRTHSAGELEEFLEGFEFPLVAHLRETQVYVYCARDGLTGVRPAAIARASRTGSNGAR